MNRCPVLLECLNFLNLVFSQEENISPELISQILDEEEIEEIGKDYENSELNIRRSIQK